jgi:glutamyl-tRNA reductase
MSLLAIGLNHRSASPELLERAAVTSEDVPKVLHDLLAGEHISEAVLLTTCNRVEVYAETATFHGGVTEVGEVLARAAGLPFEELHRSLYVHHEARAVQHLFSVVCGLDSMLVGEAQILGQVRQAYKISRDEASAGRGLSELMREALRVGKRAHAETGIDTAAASLVGVGLRVAGEALTNLPAALDPAAGRLEGARVVLVGAGSTGALAGSLLRRAGVGQLVIANRSLERARRLAAKLDGRAVGLDSLDNELREADLVVTATGATLPVITAEAVARGLAERGDRGMVLLDLGLPRDVELAARELPGVSLIDLEALGSALAGSDVVTDVDAVRTLVAEEVASYLDRQRALRVAPTVAALRARAAEMVATELDRLSARLPTLSERERAEVASTVRRVVEKLLHAPTVRVKELAESPGGDRYAEALHELFELDPRKAQAVSSPGLDELPGSTGPTGQTGQTGPTRGGLR